MTAVVDVVDERVGAGAPGGGECRRALVGLVWSFAVRFGLFGFGTFMSLWRIDVPPLNSDELVYSRAGELYWAGDYSANPEHPPLGKFFIGAAEHVFGATVWAARFPAAVALLFGGVLLWWWLSRVAGAAAGRIAAVLWWTIPGLISFPEALGAGPHLDLPQRWAMLDPLAGVLALGTLAAGWWWGRSHRLAWALTCGLLAGAAVATKVPALLIIVVPGVVGSLGTLFAPGPGWAVGVPVVVGRVVRALGHGVTWVVGGVVAFAMAYSPMGYKAAEASVRTGWRFQRVHGMSGHSILLRGEVYQHSPWWSLAWWQYVGLGPVLSVVAVCGTVAGLVVGDRLTAYLTAAWVVPMVGLVPLSHLALPHYDLVWRAPLIGGCVAGGAAGIRRLGLVPYGRWVRVGVVVLALLPAGMLGVRTVGHTVGLAPSGYAALPGVVASGEVQVVGNVTLVRHYLPDDVVHGVRNAPRPHRAAPGTIILDRASTGRGSDFGLTAWARLHHYRYISTGTLDVYVRPG